MKIHFRAAVANAPLDGASYVIAIANHIYLKSGSLVIPEGVNVTLTVDNSGVSWNVTALGDFDVIIVEGGGVLVFDGCGC
ncbi:MAG: hypothetical protein LBE76_02200 [Nitrososphaerota archaeon]|nr:hypothetical protein [Nitrososphaerota archaeon]